MHLGVKSNISEHVEVTYDDEVDEGVKDSKVSNLPEEKESKAITNGKIKKKKLKPTSNDKKAKLKKLRANYPIIVQLQNPT